MATAGLSLSGMASGIDTKSVIDQLMSLERQPLVQLQQKKQALSNQNSAFQAVNGKLQALQGAANDLTLDLNIKAKAASTTNANVLTATAGSGAALGNYRIRVDQLATATTATTNAAIGSSINDPTLPLTSLNTVSPISTGSFTIQYNNGGGVTNATVNVTAGMVLNDVFNAISTATGGQITAALGTGADVNKVVLTGAAGVTSLVAGSSSDTSNFASVMNLRGGTFDPVALTMKSTGGIGVTNINVGIGNANAAGLSTPITTNGAGSFQINGTTITYNTATDSIKNVLDRINSSAAGVMATYNTVNDKITITSRSTGSGAITMSDTTGDFLSATGLTDPARQLITNGQNAKIGIEGVNGFSSATLATDFTADVSSPTNDFTNIVPGVTFSAKSVSTANSRETIAVTTDNTAITGKVKAFVDAYNAAIDSIDGTRAKGQPDAFDGDLRVIEDRIQGLVSASLGGTTGVRALVDLGISTTKADRQHLSFDQTKFGAAMAANPDAVAAVFQTSTTGIAQQFNSYLQGVSGTAGVFATRNASTQQQLRTFDGQIANMNTRLDLKRKTMVQQFAAMEQAVSKLKSQKNAFMSQLGSLG